MLMVMAVEIVEPRGLDASGYAALTETPPPTSFLCAGGGRAWEGTHGWFGGIPRAGKLRLHPPAHRHARLRRTCPCFMAGVHQVASLVQRWVLGTPWSGTPDHLDAYLGNSCSFQPAHPAHAGMLFYRLLQQAVVYPSDVWGCREQEHRRGNRDFYCWMKSPSINGAAGAK